MANENKPAPTDTPAVTNAPTEQPVTTQPPVKATSTPTSTITQTPTVVVTPAPVVLTSQQATATTLETMIEAIKLSTNSPGKFALAGLESYILGMKPGMPVTKNDLVMHQVGLWKTLYNLLETADQDFNKIYSVVLGLFVKHKDGVFHEHYVFRGMSDITLDKEEIKAFQVLVNLIKVTADPVGRQQALKQNVDISRTLASVFSESARQKILSFYGM